MNAPEKEDIRDTADNSEVLLALQELHHIFSRLSDVFSRESIDDGDQELLLILDEVITRINETSGPLGTDHPRGSLSDNHQELLARTACLNAELIEKGKMIRTDLLNKLAQISRDRKINSLYHGISTQQGLLLDFKEGK